MAATPKFVKLLRSLKEATLQGRLEWSERFPERENSFEVNLSEAIVFLNRDYDDQGENYFVMIHDVKGKMLESESLSPDDAGYDEARTLFEVVRRNAFKIDDLLDRVIANLEGKKI